MSAADDCWVRVKTPIPRRIRPTVGRLLIASDTDIDDGAVRSFDSDAAKTSFAKLPKLLCHRHAWLLIKRGGTEGWGGG